jgi:hypothetical protein
MDIYDNSQLIDSFNPKIFYSCNTENVGVNNLGGEEMKTVGFSGNDFGNPSVEGQQQSQPFSKTFQQEHTPIGVVQQKKHEWDVMSDEERLRIQERVLDDRSRFDFIGKIFSDNLGKSFPAQNSPQVQEYYGTNSHSPNPQETSKSGPAKRKISLKKNSSTRREKPSNKNSSKPTTTLATRYLFFIIKILGSELILSEGQTPLSRGRKLWPILCKLTVAHDPLFQ